MPPKEDRQIVQSRLHSVSTVRPTSSKLEKILFKRLPVLDHGFVRVVDYMGDDAAIVQAARVSYGKGTTKRSNDRNLIRYLMRHSHTSPFEMLELKLHVKLPIFVARQWVRHRTASINEYSGRYSILDKEFYLPSFFTIAAQSKDKKQGRGQVLSKSEATGIRKLLRADAVRNYDNYIWMLNEATSKEHDEQRLGLARELARINLTLSTYTQWYWKIDLHNLFHFLQLRTDTYAQHEIRAYATVISRIVKLWVPLAYEAFEEYHLHASTLSEAAVQVLKRMIAGERVSAENSGLSRTEWQELAIIFDLQ